MTRQGRVVCIGNHKGGVGKTSSVCNIGAGLAREGRRVLVVDLDPQANLSQSLGLHDVGESNVYGLLRGDIEVREAIYSVTENLDIIPSTLDLANAELELGTEIGREGILKNAMAPILDRYDYILIDCPPSLGLLTINALVCASQVILPVQPHYLPVQGLAWFSSVIDKIQRKLNQGLQLGGVFITQFDMTTTLNRDVVDKIEEHFGPKLFKTKIRKNIKLAEAPSQGLDIFRYSDSCNGAQDYAALSREIMDRFEIATQPEEVAVVN